MQALIHAVTWVDLFLRMFVLVLILKLDAV